MNRLACAALAALAAIPAFAEIKVGIIGLDTSHAICFTEVLNVKKPEFAKDFRVTAAYQWGSRDIVSSTNRYPKYLARIAELGVEVVPTVDELLAKVDCVCLETNDGREHCRQAEQVFRSGKLCFIDKPIAHDYADAKRICELAKRTNAKFFSASALRYSKIAQDCRAGKYGKVAGAQLYSPSPIEEQGTHSRYTWYGIHGFEPLLTVMGRGVESVRTTVGADDDVTVLRYRDGRVGSVRSNRKRWDYGGTIFFEKGKPVTLDPAYEGYEPLLERICSFFRTGEAPIDPEETLELFAVMEAAERSVKSGGSEVKLSDL